MTIQIRNPKWADQANTAIEVEAIFPWIEWLGWIPFLATLSDSEPHSAEVFNRCISGECGGIAHYIVPPLTLSNFQQAHDTYLNSKAKERKYDSIHTAALRAGYPGPYHDEGVAYATWMDSCNSIGYAILAEVQAGTRPAPQTIEEYIALLPELILPPEVI